MIVLKQQLIDGGPLGVLCSYPATHELSSLRSGDSVANVPRGQRWSSSPLCAPLDWIVSSHLSSCSSLLRSVLISTSKWHRFLLHVKNDSVSDGYGTQVIENLAGRNPRTILANSIAASLMRVAFENRPIPRRIFRPQSHRCGEPQIEKYI